MWYRCGTGAVRYGTGAVRVWYRCGTGVVWYGMGAVQYSTVRVRYGVLTSY